MGRRPIVTTVLQGRAIRRLVTLYESLDDLLQAADDHNSNDDDEDNDVELLTEEALEKKQECVTSYPLHRASSHFYNLGQKVDLLHSKFSYRCSRQSGRQLKTLILI